MVLLGAALLGCGDSAVPSTDSTSSGTDSSSTSGSSESSTSSALPTGTSTADASSGSSTEGSSESTGDAFEASVSIIATPRDEDEVLSLVRMDYADGVFAEPDVLTSDVARLVGFMELSPQASALTYVTFDPFGAPWEAYVLGLENGRPQASSHLTDPRRPDLTESRAVGLTPDESRIVFRAYAPKGGPARTYVASVSDGELGTPWALAEAGVSGVGSHSFASDGSRLAFTTVEGPSIASIDLEPPEVASLPAPPPDRVVTNGPSFAAGDAVVWYALGDLDTDARQAVYVDVSAPQPWTAVPLHPGVEDTGTPVASPDGRWLTYRFSNGEMAERYVVRIDGASVGTPSMIGSWLDPDGDTTNRTAWSDDGDWLALVEGPELYLVDMTGAGPGLPVLVSADEAPTDGRIGVPFFDADATWVYYRRATADESTLYRASVEVLPQAVSAGQRVVTNSFEDIILSPDGNRAVFVADETDRFLEYSLWHVNVAGDAPGEPERVGPKVPVSAAQPRARFSPDSHAFLFSNHASPISDPTYYLVEGDAETPVELGELDNVLITNPVDEQAP